MEKFLLAEIFVLRQRRGKEPLFLRVFAAKFNRPSAAKKMMHRGEKYAEEGHQLHKSQL